MPQIDPIYFAIVVAVVIMLGTSVRILKEYERAVIFRLGRLTGTRGPGLVFMIPFWIERMQRISLRVIVNDVTPQDVITKDNMEDAVKELADSTLSPTRSLVVTQGYAQSLETIKSYVKRLLQEVLKNSDSMEVRSLQY